MPTPKDTATPDAIAPAVLQASRATVELFVARGSSDASVKALAEHAGVSERTFYRYFPRKEDAVRPFLQAGLQRIVQLFEQRPADEPPIDALRAAWTPAWPVREARASAVLYRILDQDDAFRAVRLLTVIDAEAAWARALAPRLNVAPGSTQATLAGAAVVTAFRIAWQAFAQDPRLDPLDTFMAHLGAFGPQLFAPAGPSGRVRGAPARAAAATPRTTPDAPPTRTPQTRRR